MDEQHQVAGSSREPMASSKGGLVVQGRRGWSSAGLEHTHMHGKRIEWALAYAMAPSPEGYAERLEGQRVTIARAVGGEE